MQHLVALCSRPEAAKDVSFGRFVRPIVLDKRLKFRDPSLNSSREIPPEAVRGRFSTVFRYNFGQEADNDVISGVACKTISVWISV